MCLIPDVDEIYLMGELKKVNEGDSEFEEYEIWRYDGKNILIGRNFSTGSSIIVDYDI